MIGKIILLDNKIGKIQAKQNTLKFYSELFYVNSQLMSIIRVRYIYTL